VACIPRADALGCSNAAPSERIGSEVELGAVTHRGRSRFSAILTRSATASWGPAQESKPREVLVKPDYFEEIDTAGVGVEE